MKFRYKVGDFAKQELKEISDYWTGKAGLTIARKILAGIFEVVITLSRRPGIGVKVVEFGPGVRKFPAGSHIIYYREKGSRGIDIFHVFHAARDQMRAWKESESKPE